ADVRDAAGTATPPAPTTDAGVIEPTTDAGVIELTDAGVIELTPTQRTIAARMAESRAQIPEFTLEAEIDMEAVAEVREELRELGREPVPSFNDMVVKAVALALRKHPALNSSWAGGRIRRHERVNVGIAVATEDALYVPTIFDADALPIVEIALRAREQIEKVMAGTVTPDELHDGTL